MVVDVGAFVDTDENDHARSRTSGGIGLVRKPFSNAAMLWNGSYRDCEAQLVGLCDGTRVPSDLWLCGHL